MHKRFGLAAAIVTAAAHIATSWRYGYYRDELYFIACAKRLAWGYVDMPPLAAFVSWLAAPAHDNIVLLRLTVAVAAACTVYLAFAICAEFGGGPFAQVLSGVAVALTPAYLFLGNTLTTTSYEPFLWALIIYACLRLVRSSDDRWWYLIAFAFAVALYAKYSALLLAAALCAGLLGTAERRILRTKSFPLAALAVAIALLPNVLWQASHGWPMAAVLQGDVAARHAFNSGMQFEYRQPVINAGIFLAEQFLFTNPLAAPIWLFGLAACFREPAFARGRFIAVAFVLLLVAGAALNAKGYYIAGIYTPLIAAGAAALERLGQRSWRVAVSALACASGLIFLPFTLPALSANQLIRYSTAFGITGRNGSPAHLPQPLFADEFGWRGLTRRVADEYDSLPAAQRARTAIFSDTYAGAAAIEFYGPAFHLPQPISAQNNYYLWGTRGFDGSSVLAVGASQAGILRQNFRSVVLLTTFTDPYRWAIEGPTPIYLCTRPKAPLDVLWPRLRWYGA